MYVLRHHGHFNYITNYPLAKNYPLSTSLLETLGDETEKALNLKLTN